jgi:hypothetical protein
MNQKVVVFESPAAVATDATSAATVDTTGFDFAHILYVNVKATQTDSVTKFSTFTVSHGTTTHASHHTTISGLQGTTNATASSTQFVLPNPNSATLGSLTQCWVNLRGKEKILRIVKQAAASHSTVAGIALLSRTADTPDTIAEMQSTNSVTTATIGYG